MKKKTPLSSLLNINYLVNNNKNMNELVKKKSIESILY